MLLAQANRLLAETASSVVDNVPAITDSASTDSVGRESALDAALRMMLSGEFQGLTDYAQKSLLPNLLPSCVGLAVVFIGYFAAKYVAILVSRPICRRIDETFGRFAGTAIFYAIMLSLIAAVASTLGVHLGGLAAVIAAAGFAIGLAFQGTLSNFAAGVLMIVFRPFKVGDMVNIAGVQGKVNEIDLFTTTLDTPDNRRLIIPNSSISGSTIENISFHAHRRVEVLVGINYSADIDATRQALQTALDTLASETIPGEGRGTKVILANLGVSAVEWKVRMWVKSTEFWPMSESLTAAVKRQLDLAGIEIPYPQMDVHLNHVDQFDKMDNIGTKTTPRPRMRPARRDVFVDHEAPLERKDHRLPYAS